MSAVTLESIVEPELREGTPDRPGKPRHVWVTDALTADPHEPGYFWLVQHVEGSWVKADDNDYQVIWEKRYDDDPTTTRVMYASMDSTGNIKNAHR